jgi:hypothetical protein
MLLFVFENKLDPFFKPDKKMVCSAIEICVSDKVLCSMALCLYVCVLAVCRTLGRSLS